jgi:uncharacterized protein YbbC (DUF1343 family)
MPKSWWLICRSTLLLMLLVCSMVANASAAPAVLVGIDRLAEAKYQRLLLGKRLGVLTNNASHDQQGRLTLDRLIDHHEWSVTAIFTPEHGLSAQLDEKIDNTGQRYRHIPVYSLYGTTRVPSEQQWQQIDVLIFDLQTVGVRYYTFITTLALVMQQAKQFNKAIVVLDRVNPLGGDSVQGSSLDKDYYGDFIAYYPIPMQYGLTTGELALFYNRYFSIDAKLSIVPLKNWHRQMLFNETGLVWSAPSPALLTFKQAFIYSFLGSLEALNLSVARSQSNEHAFEYYGAPYITQATAESLVKQLQALQLPGLNFAPVQWLADRGKFSGEVCHGFQVSVVDYHQVQPLYSLIKISQLLQKYFSAKLNLAAMDKWLGASWLRQGIATQQSANLLLAKAAQSHREFSKQRRSVLLYT